MVDPTPFFQSCVFDMCQFQGQQSVLCDQLQAYTDACQSAGAKVHQWRTEDFCRKSPGGPRLLCPTPSLPSLPQHLSVPPAALACPPNSSYSLCVSACPETCLGVVGSPGCQDVCVEGCRCDPGFILSDDMCVALKDCGCQDSSGSYHPVSVNSL